MVRQFIFQRLDALQGHVLFQLQPGLFIDIRNFVGDVRRFLGRFVFGIAVNADFDEAGVAGLPHVDLGRQIIIGLRDGQRGAVVVAFTPFLVQLQILNDFVEDLFGPYFLELGLDEERVERGRALREAQRRNVGNVLFDSDANGAGPGFGQDESDRRGGQHDQQEHGQDDHFANANDAPVIEEVEFGLHRTRICFRCFHN